MISLVVNAKNAQDEIESCIKSALGLFDELVVVDDGSSDGTVQIAKKFTKKVYKHKSLGYVEPARNYAVDKAGGDWILILDTDEEITPKLKNELISLSKKKNIDFVKIPRKNIIFGKWIRHSGWWPDFQVRFFRKGKVVWGDQIHSQPKTKGLEFKLPEDEKLAIIHHNYRDLGGFLHRMDLYSDVEAKQSVERGEKFTPANLLSQPSAEFIRRYFIWEGYKDGVHGLILAILQSFSFFIVQAKIWQASGYLKMEPAQTLKTFEVESRKISRDVRSLIPKTKLQRIKDKIFSKIS